MITFNEYLSLFIKFLLGFGLSFQLPVLIFFLAKLGIVTDKLLSKYRKYAILMMFIAAAILTPSPDALSQVLMAVPCDSLRSEYLRRQIRGKKKTEPTPVAEEQAQEEE